MLSGHARRCQIRIAMPEMGDDTENLMQNSVENAVLYWPLISSLWGDPDAKELARFLDDALFCTTLDAAFSIHSF